MTNCTDVCIMLTQISYWINFNCPVLSALIGLPSPREITGGDGAATNRCHSFYSGRERMFQDGEMMEKQKEWTLGYQFRSLDLVTVSHESGFQLNR